MTWTLWADIINHYHELIKNRIWSPDGNIVRYSFIYLLRMGHFVFLWFSSDPYDSSLAIGHITVGVVCGIGVVLTVFGHDVKHELKKIRIHLPF